MNKLGTDCEYMNRSGDGKFQPRGDCCPLCLFNQTIVMLKYHVTLQKDDFSNSLQVTLYTSISKCILYCTYGCYNMFTLYIETHINVIYNIHTHTFIIDYIYYKFDTWYITYICKITIYLFFFLFCHII